MPQVTLDIPEENIPLLLEITEALGIAKKNIFIKNESPDWHLPILNERLESYRTGRSQVTAWDDFEKELNREDEIDEL